MNLKISDSTPFKTMVERTFDETSEEIKLLRTLIFKDEQSIKVLNEKISELKKEINFYSSTIEQVLENIINKKKELNKLLREEGGAQKKQ